jgi:tetratricopeptide (TPR) repeat protein
MARVRQEFGNLDEAVKYAEAAVKLDPKSSAYHRALGDAYGEKAQKASIFKQISLAPKIKPEFEAALALDPKDPENVLNMIEYYLEAPGIVGGDKKKAHQLALDQVKSDPSNGYLSLVQIAIAEKQQDKVEGLLQQAVDANPKGYDAQIALAGFFSNSANSDPAKAELHARAANEVNPDRISGYRLLAHSLAVQKRFDEAAKVIARAETAIPDDLSPYVNVARAMLRVNAELPKAEAYLKKYLTETKEPEPNAPPIAAAHYWLGLVYDKQGRKPEAIGELETALRIKPDFEPAKQDLKRIKGK